MEVQADLVTDATRIFKKLIYVADQEIGLTKWDAVKDELRNLLLTFTMCLAILEDAESRPLTEDSERMWLRWVTDAAYDADDIFDEFSYYRALPRHEMDSVTCNKVLSCSSPIAFPYEMSHKIKAISQKFDEIINEMHKIVSMRYIIGKFGRINSNQDNEQQNRQVIRDGDLQIVGRVNDKSNVLDMLLTIINPSSSLGNFNNCENYSVISIVGMGGVGKTALAKLVYKDDIVAKHFELRMWVDMCHVSDYHGLLGNIARSITGTIYSNDSNLNVLEHLICDKLSRKKYMLVLDNLWMKDLSKWDKLKYLLSIGAPGSKILVTTRIPEVALLVGWKIPPYNLQQLSIDECWSIIQRIAFSSGGASDTPEMVEIGMGMARKCCGLPLIAKILGCILLSTKHENWSKIRSSELWDIPAYHNEVLPIMKLSYDNLPSYLKTCFSYCSIFPQDHKIYKETLIRLWMAEGFIQVSDERNEISMEDIGNDYFDYLLGISFFQDVGKDELSQFENMFSMPTLIYDLARSVVEDRECSITKASSIEYINKVRRLGLVTDDDMSTVTFPKVLYNSNKLRTVVGVEGSSCKNIKSIFSNQHLRVLELKSYPIGMMLDFSRLIHLQYLDLSDCQYILSGQSISTLYNLQTLVLRCCDSLYELPKDIGSLKNLRHLDVSCTMITSLPDSLTSLCNLRTLILNNSQLNQLAIGFRSLKHLKHLDVSGTKIKELPNSITCLINLNTFKFDSCRYLEALPKNCGSLTSLRILDLSGTRIKELPDDSISICLRNLQTLKLAHCKLPKELGNLENLKHLTFEGERNETPSGIGRLTNLQTLPQYVVRKDTQSKGSNITDLKDLNLLEGEIKICNLENVGGKADAKEANLKGKENIQSLDLHWSTTRSGSDQSSYDDDVAVLDALQPHPNLNTFKIKNFKGLKLPAWMSDSISSCLPNLVELELSDCSNCQIQLSAIGQLRNLEVLSIHGMSSVHCLQHDQASLATKSSIPPFKKKKRKSVKNPRNKLYKGESSTGENASPPSPIKVNSMEIAEEDRDAPRPQPSVSTKQFSSFPSLKKMTISHCHNLKDMQTPFPSLKVLDLRSCHVLTVLHGTDSLTSLEKLTIRDCKQLKLSSTVLKSLFSTALLDIDTPISPF